MFSSLPLRSCVWHLSGYVNILHRVSKERLARPSTEPLPLTKSMHSVIDTLSLSRKRGRDYSLLWNSTLEKRPCVWHVQSFVVRGFEGRSLVSLGTSRETGRRKGVRPPQSSHADTWFRYDTSTLGVPRDDEVPAEVSEVVLSTWGQVIRGVGCDRESTRKLCRRCPLLKSNKGNDSWTSPLWNNNHESPVAQQIID